MGHAQCVLVDRCCLPSCTSRGITAHVPHTSDVGFPRRRFAEPERGLTKRLDWLCLFSLSILDRFGPRASAIPNSASLLRMLSMGFDSHRPLRNSPFSEDVRVPCLRFAFPLAKGCKKNQFPRSNGMQKRQLYHQAVRHSQKDSLWNNHLRIARHPIHSRTHSIPGLPIHRAGLSTLKMRRLLLCPQELHRL